MSHFCRIFGVENSFLSVLGPKLDLLALGSYADVLAHCGGGGTAVLVLVVVVMVVVSVAVVVVVVVVVVMGSNGGL